MNDETAKTVSVTETAPSASDKPRGMLQADQKIVMIAKLGPLPTSPEGASNGQ